MIEEATVATLKQGVLFIRSDRENGTVPVCLMACLLFERTIELIKKCFTTSVVEQFYSALKMLSKNRKFQHQRMYI